MTLQSPTLKKAIAKLVQDRLGEHSSHDDFSVRTIGGVDLTEPAAIAVGNYVIREVAEKIPGFSIKDDKLVVLIDDTELPNHAKVLGGHGCYKLVSEVLA